jgi:hypothetical protein
VRCRAAKGGAGQFATTPILLIDRTTTNTNKEQVRVASMAMPLPQELLDVVVDELGADIPSLKACSLTHRMMRIPSQRLLLHSLTLGGDGSRSPHYSDAHALLDESAHIAEYVTRLRIQLPKTLTVADSDSIQHVLRKLKKVRRCIIAGPAQDWDSSLWYRWKSIPPAVQSALIEFISDGMVRELHVVAVHDIPCPVFFKIAQAPLTVLRFFLTSVEEGPTSGFPILFL